MKGENRQGGCFVKILRLDGWMIPLHGFGPVFQRDQISKVDSRPTHLDLCKSIFAVKSCIPGVFTSVDRTLHISTMDCIYQGLLTNRS